MQTYLCGSTLTEQSAIEAERQAIYAELLTATSRIAASCASLDELRFVRMFARVVKTASVGDYRAREEKP